MPVYVETTCPDVQLPQAVIAWTARRVLRGEARDGAIVTIILVDDDSIRTLNHRYRGRDRATDVLSFGLHEGIDPDARMWGEVYVSVDRARDQAARDGVSLMDEVRRLVVHGCLHLLGYDHHTGSTRRLMRRKEADYLVA